MNGQSKAKQLKWNLKLAEEGYEIMYIALELL